MRENYETVFNCFKNKGLILLENNYINNRIKMKCKDEFGYLYSLTYSTVKDTRIKSYNIVSPNNPYSIFNMELYLFNNYNIYLKILTNNYINEKQLLTIQCECGNIYYATWNHLQQGNDLRCEKCRKKQSYISLCIENYLKECNIKYIKEYRFKDCRYIRPLPFDYYLVDYNCCIEVNGGQHYYKSKIYKESLEIRQLKDKIKTDYCNKNNIKILNIPYWNIYNNELKNTYKKMINEIIMQ